jgi:hypothetical protein
VETSREELENNISIRISENPINEKLNPVGSGDSINPNLVRKSAKYKIEIVYKGNTIGYLTNYTNLQYYDDVNNKIVPIEHLTVEQFKKIFDCKGKDPLALMLKFKDEYNNSRRVFNILSRYVKKGQVVEIQPKELKKFINFNVGAGQYDYVAEAVKLKDFKYNTIDGGVYIMDRSRRYKKSNNYETLTTIVTNADKNKVKEIEKQIDEALSKRDTTELLGRYVAAIKLPNGIIRFIELTTGEISDAEQNDLINEINERSRKSKSENIKPEDKEGQTIYT